jgi:hypothetical protein
VPIAGVIGIKCDQIGRTKKKALSDIGARGTIYFLEHAPIKDS